jgi:hypothetical protein
MQGTSRPTIHASQCRRSGGRGGVRRRTPPPTRRQQHINRCQLQSTYDNPNATVSPFTDIMINRLPTALTNSSTTCRQPSLPQTQPPTTRQHLLPHLLPPPLLPQPVRVSLPQDQVWTCMTNPRILAQVGLTAYYR